MAPPCHPERSEGSPCYNVAILHFVQDDKALFSGFFEEQRKKSTDSPDSNALRSG